MIKSKFEFQETKIIIRKMIQKGRNVNKEGECKIYIEIIRFLTNGTRKTRRIPTEIFVKPQNWNSKKDGYVKTSDPESNHKNNVINTIFTDYALQLEQRERGTWDENFNPKDLVPLDDMFPKKTKTLTDYIDDYIKYRKSVNTPYNTLKSFTSLKNRIERYEKDKSIKLTFEDINLTFSDKFYSFLIEEEFEEGTISKTYTLLITILNYFYDRKDEMNLKLTDKFKNKRFRRGEKSENEPHPLIREEFEILCNHTFNNLEMKKNQTRFLLQCSLGCRYSDLFDIIPEKIVDDCLIYYPTKTRHKRENKVVVPLNKISKEILQGLKNDTRQLNISNQKYNDGLEKMFKELIKEYPHTFTDTYTSHDARDTFITFCLQSGVDIPSLLKMVGQESYEIMKKYFKAVPKHMIDRMKEVKFFN